MKRALGVLLLLAPACISTRTVGMTDLKLTAPRPKPIVCLNDANGTTGQLTHGTVVGRPAVNVTFGVGVDFTLDQRLEAEGHAVYGGEVCIRDGQVCDHVLVIERGAEVFVLYRQSYSEQPTPAPASAKVIVDQAVRDGVLTRLAGISLDPPSRIAFASLADARESNAWVKLAGVGASAGMMTTGEYTGDQAMMEEGRDRGIAAASTDFREEERPLLTKFPNLVPVLRFGQMMCIEGEPPK